MAPGKRGRLHLIFNCGAMCNFWKCWNAGDLFYHMFELNQTLKHMISSFWASKYSFDGCPYGSLHKLSFLMYNIHVFLNCSAVLHLYSRRYVFTVSITFKWLHLAAYISFRPVLRRNNCRVIIFLFSLQVTFQRDRGLIRNGRWEFKLPYINQETLQLDFPTDISVPQCSAHSTFSMTKAHCNTSNEEFFYDESNLHTCSNIPPAYSYRRMISTDVHLMKSLITPLKWVLPINAGGLLLYSLALSVHFGVAGRARGRGRRGGWRDKCAV